jgi:hypothetical protein
MKRIIFLGLMIMSFAGINAQSLLIDHTATHFYIVNFDKNLNEIFNSTEPDSKNPFSFKEKVNKEFISSIIDTFYKIASDKFKSELGLELMPLNELQGKVKYNESYPDCPYVANIKKVVKSVSGYQYFVDYYVNVFTDLSVNSAPTLTPAMIKPIYAISFTIYNNNGKLLKQIQLCYKAKKSLAKTHEINTNTNKEVKTELCSFYNEALDQVAMAYKRI